MLNTLFPYVVYINLDRRTDRNQFMVRQLAERQIQAIRWSAIDTRSGDLPAGLTLRGESGCMLSHLTVLKWALKRGVKNLFVLEDDALFTEEYGRHMGSVLQDLADHYAHWDLFYPFVAPYESTPTFTGPSPRLVKIPGQRYTHAYGIKHHAMKIMVEAIHQKVRPIDHTFRDVGSRLLSVVRTPINLIIQRNDMSDIRMKESARTWSINCQDASVIHDS